MFGAGARKETSSDIRSYLDNRDKMYIFQNCFLFGIIAATLKLMKVVAFLLVGKDARSHGIAQGAARLVFPESVVTTFDTLEEALKHKLASGLELLVLADPDEAEVLHALEATDATGLRRWAIVVLGTAPAIEGLEIVSPQEWTEPLLARVFRSAIAQRRLMRENERLRGDLRTIAHRISHDLRAPLGGILIAGEALTELVAEHNPSAVALGKSLLDSADDMGKLIDRVSLLTRVSANPVAKRPVAMEEVVWAALQRLERQILKKSASVIQPASWPEVEGVSSWLETVWWNLLVNVLQHGKEAARIELGWSQNEREFRFWVCDAGGGIPSEIVGTLFQPFHLLHRTNAGKGLGLSIVQRLLELQGGTCGYEPVSTGGSIFFFTLPARKRADATDGSRLAANTASTSLLSPAIPDPDPRQAT
jgi:signal transduction histidine kinase